MKNRLLQLLRDNAAAPQALRVETDGDEATIYIYDVIDAWFGVSAERFAKELAALKGKTVNLRINSPGGDVFEARAIVAAMAAFGGKIVAHVDGVAASAASFIAVNASEVRMIAGSFLMIHNAWTYTYGDKGELRTTADLLEKVDGTIAADYMRKTGKALDAVAAMMDAETWLTADEAKAEGFADAVDAATGGGSSAAALAWNLSAYEKTPSALRVAQPDPALARHRNSLERRMRLIERT